LCPELLKEVMPAAPALPSYTVWDSCRSTCAEGCSILWLCSIVLYFSDELLAGNSIIKETYYLVFPFSCLLVTMLFSIIDWNKMNSQRLLHCMFLFDELLNDHMMLVLRLKWIKLVITGASCNLGCCWWFAAKDIGCGNEGQCFLQQAFQNFVRYKNVQIESVLCIILPL
jgi:hypothetical protein